MEAVFLLVVGSTSSRVLAITALTLAVGFSGFAISGIYSSFQLATTLFSTRKLNHHSKAGLTQLTAHDFLLSLSLHLVVNYPE